MVRYFPQEKDLSDLEYTSQALKNMKGLCFGSLNIRGISSKVDNVRLLLERSEIDYLALSETFLTENILDSELVCKDYKIIRSDRTAESGKKSGGGILLYTKSQYDFLPYENGLNCSKNLESCWVKLNLPHCRPTTICALYRPPDGSVEECLNELQHQYDSLQIAENEDVLFLGDINIDYLKPSPAKARLRIFLRNTNLTQVITRPTRVTLESSTLIDHIWVNNVDWYSHRGTIETGLSDHALIFAARKRAKLSKECETIHIRSYRNFCPDNFAIDVSNIDWSPVYNESDVEIATCIFQDILCSVIDKHLPYRDVSVRIKSAPWVNREFLSLIDAKEHHSTAFKKCPCILHLERRKHFVKLVKNMKTQLKRNYVLESLERHKNDPKRLWKTIRTFWPGTKSKNSKINKINGLTDKANIAETLNKHFCDIGPGVQNDINTDKNFCRLSTDLSSTCL